MRFWLVFALLLGCTTVAVKAQSGPERQLMELANEARAARGLGPLVWDKSLAAASRQHAVWVARSAQLSHQYPGEIDLAARASQAGARFELIAENIAQGSSAGQLHDEWMHSPPHRANLLDPRVNRVGIAIVRKGDTLYGVEDFSHAVADLGPQQVEAKVAAMLVARGITPLASHDAARATCQMEHGSAGPKRPMFVMRWEGADLGRLPDVLEDRIRTGKYHTAAVGACGGSSPQAFASYHVAVMLYY
jgi:Cysteine-rich secretory protein family